MKFHKHYKFALALLGWLMLFTFQASAQTDTAKETEKPSKQYRLVGEPDNRSEINKKPLRDFATEVLDKWERKEIDLTKSFTVELEGTITKDGKFDIENTKYIKTEGNEDIVNLAKSAIEAINESGWFAYFSVLGVKDFNLTVSQNENDFSAVIISELKSEAEARTMARGLKELFKIAQMDGRNIGEDEKNILKHWSAISEKTQMIMKFEMPKPIFHEMVNRKLQEASDYKSKSKS